MLVSEFILEINDTLRSIEDDAPISGSEEYDYWLRTAVRLRRNLYRDVTKTWASTWQVLELGTVSASTAPSFDIDEEFLGASDSCYIITTDGQRHDYKIVKPKERNVNRQEVYIAGADPQSLFFSQPILADTNIVGGSLYLPGYFMPDPFVRDTDTVVVDDPDWLIVATAAKIAAGDLTYEDRTADLNAEANSLWLQMLKNNRRGTYNNPRKTPYNVHRITSPGS